jgi:phosphopantothenoylcysteine decarboxylase/phosphopantothenate--cysteine ligase
VLITAGPTREHLDPIRFLTNASTGRMGFALAERALARGAQVSIVCGPVALTPPSGADVVPVESAEEMLKASEKLFGRSDVVIGAAAVGDWRFERRARGKIKRTGDALTVRLVPNKDILLELSRRRKKAASSQLMVGFALETGDWLARAKAKLEKKGIDLIVANKADALASESSEAAVLDRAGACRRVPRSAKASVADAILDRIEEALHERTL